MNFRLHTLANNFSRISPRQKNRKKCEIIVWVFEACVLKNGTKGARNNGICIKQVCNFDAFEKYRGEKF
jgi:hypothetical protein